MSKFEYLYIIKSFDTMVRNHINIAIFGSVSAGKSTLTNAMFVEQFSDMRIKRTTALPQIYEEYPIDSDVDASRAIRKANRTKNTEIMSRTENSATPLKYDEIEEIVYQVPKMFDMVSLYDGIYFNVYDTPGLNDSKTKDVYFRYVKEHIYKIDIAILVLDIQNAMNTSDDIAILNLILSGIAANKAAGTDTRLIILLNKCDEMKQAPGRENARESRMIPVDEELHEMFDQVFNIVREKTKEHGITLWKIICISAEDAYIYRMLGRDPECILDDKYIAKLGHNEYGKSKWKRLSARQQREKIKSFFSKGNGADYKSSIKFSGFDEFKYHLRTILTGDTQMSLVMNHINRQLAKITNAAKEDISAELDEMTSIRDRVRKLMTAFRLPKVNRTRRMVPIDKHIKEFMDRHREFNKTYLTETVLTVSQVSKAHQIKNTWMSVTKNAGETLRSIRNQFLETVVGNMTTYYVNIVKSYASTDEVISSALSELAKLILREKVIDVVNTHLLPNLHKYGFLNQLPYRPNDDRPNTMLNIFKYITIKCDQYDISTDRRIVLMFNILINMPQRNWYKTSPTFSGNIMDHPLIRMERLRDSYSVHPNSKFYILYKHWRMSFVQPTRDQYLSILSRGTNEIISDAKIKRTTDMILMDEIVMDMLRKAHPTDVIVRE